MAQAKVTNFFKIRKGSDIVHPSKRSKLDIEEQISHAAVEEKCKEPEAAKQLKKVVEARKPAARKTRSVRSKKTKNSRDIRKLLQKNEEIFKDKSVQKEGVGHASEDDKTLAPTKDKEDSSAAVVQKEGVKLVAEDDTTASNKGTEKSSTIVAQSKPSSKPASDTSTAEHSENKETVVGTEDESLATAASDDHNGSEPQTPCKRPVRGKTTVNEKRGRKTVRKDLLLESESRTPEKGYDFSAYVKTDRKSSARRKLVLKRRLSGDGEVPSASDVAELLRDAEVKATEDEGQIVKDVSQVKSKTPSKKLEVMKESLDSIHKGKKKQEVSEDVPGHISKGKPETDSVTIKQPVEKIQLTTEPLPPSLKLPNHFMLLAEFFNSVDTVLGMLNKRSETCTFDKLKPSVQNLMKRNFEEKHLGQIKAVYPTALKFRQEKNVPRFGKKTSCYQLTIEPDLNDVSDEKEIQENNGAVPMNAAKILKRKKIFLNLLAATAKEHHRKFLASLEPPLAVPDDKITKWHPEFNVNAVPPVTPAALPQPPAVNQIRSAQDALQVARDHLTPKVKQALETVSSDKKTKEHESNASGKKTASKSLDFTTPQKQPIPPAKTPGSEFKSPSSNLSPSLKGVPDFLLAKIKAKEAAKKIALMTRTPEQDRRIEMLERLSDVGRLVSCHFKTERRECLRLEDLVLKVTNGWKYKMGDSEAERHVKLLVEVLPEWGRMTTFRNVPYLKLLDKNKNNINYMEGKISDKLKEEKSKT